MTTFILEGSFGINTYSKTKRLKINELVAQLKGEILIKVISYSEPLCLLFSVYFVATSCTTEVEVSSC